MISLVFYTEWFIPKRFGAYTIGPVCLIRTKYKEDRGLLTHELTHVKQFWSNPIMFPLRYYFSKEARLKYEAQAYKQQLEYYTTDLTELFATFLVMNYDLGITLEQARSALSAAEVISF